MKRRYYVLGVSVLSLLFLFAGAMVRYPSHGGQPASSTDDAIAKYDGASGTIQDSGITITDGNDLVFDNGESIVTTSDGVIDFTRDTAGTLTLTCSDTDNDCAMVVRSGGDSLTQIGGSSTDAISFVTDGTGDAEEVHRENSIGPDEVASMQDSIVFCGQLVDTGNVLTYIGPAAAHYLGLTTSSIAIGESSTCDTFDAETDAGADEPIHATFPAFKVSGFFCYVSAQPTNNIVLTLHSAEAVTTPTISCTITGGASSSCSSTTGSTTDIAAGATVSIEAAYTEDLDTTDIWCKMYFAVK